METYAIILISILVVACIANIVGAILDYRYRDKNYKGHIGLCIASACVYAFFAIALFIFAS